MAVVLGWLLFVIFAKLKDIKDRILRKCIWIHHRPSGNVQVHITNSIEIGISRKTVGCREKSTILWLACSSLFMGNDVLLHVSKGEVLTEAATKREVSTSAAHLGESHIPGQDHMACGSIQISKDLPSTCSERHEELRQLRKTSKSRSAPKERPEMIWTNMDKLFVQTVQTKFVQRCRTSVVPGEDLDNSTLNALAGHDNNIP